MPFDRRAAGRPRVAGNARAAAIGVARPLAIAALSALGQRRSYASGAPSSAAIVRLAGAFVAKRPVAKEGARIVVDAPAVVRLGPLDGWLHKDLARGTPFVPRAVASPNRREAHAAIRTARGRAAAATPMPRVAGEHWRLRARGRRRVLIAARRRQRNCW